MRTLSTVASRRMAMRRQGRSRAATMMEFVLILPLMLFVVLFTVDMGNVIFVNGTMQDAAYSSARAGAQVGGGSMTTDGRFPCGTTKTSTSCRQGASWTAFNAAVQNVPGYTSKQISGAQMQILTGGKCTAAATPSRSDNHVTVKVTYNHKLLTPGLSVLMSWSGSKIDNGAWAMSVTASSRCEVVR